jgi:hypothetical protein
MSRQESWARAGMSDAACARGGEAVHTGADYPLENCTRPTASEPGDDHSPERYIHPSKAYSIVVQTCKGLSRPACAIQTSGWHGVLLREQMHPHDPGMVETSSLVFGHIVCNCTGHR